MPYEMCFEDGGRGVLVSWVGVVPGRRLIEANEEMYNRDPDRKLRYQIWDFTAADHMEVSNDELRTLAFQDAQAHKIYPHHVVALVGSSEFLAAADKLYAIYADVWGGLPSETFRDVEEARRWIAMQPQSKTT